MTSASMAIFHPDERPFVDKAAEWVARASDRHEPKLTDFLDPRQQFIVESLVNREQALQFRADGGYAGAERRRFFIAPDYVDARGGADADRAACDHVGRSRIRRPGPWRLPGCDSRAWAEARQARRSSRHRAWLPMPGRIGNRGLFSAAAAASRTRARVTPN